MAGLYDISIVVINGTCDSTTVTASSADDIFLGADNIRIGTTHLTVVPKAGYVIAKFSVRSLEYTAQLYPMISYSVGNLPYTEAILYIYCIPEEYNEMIGLYIKG